MSFTVLFILFNVLQSSPHVCESMLGLQGEFQVSLGNLVCVFEKHPSRRAPIRKVQLRSCFKARSSFTLDGKT